MSKFIIPTRAGKRLSVFLDDSDDHVFRERIWSAHPKGAICFADNKLLHREIMGAKPNDCVEAKNKNLLDCRRQNLQIISRSELMVKRAKEREKAQAKAKKAQIKAMAR